MARLIFSIFAFIALFVQYSFAKDLQTKIPQILVVDAETGTILYNKGSGIAFLPSSMAKLMTAKVIFDAIKEQKLSLDKEFYVSDYAWKTGGAPSRSSTMFAAYHSYIAVKDLLLGLAVDNANDAALILAEGYAGSEKAFVQMMNQKAKDLGLQHTHFVNATGLPQEGQSITLSDALSLLQIIATNDKEFYPYYSQKDFHWNKITQKNKNPLIGLDYVFHAGISGYSDKFGYSLVSSLSKDGRTLFLAMNGIKEKKFIKPQAQQIIKWALENFHKQQIFPANKIVAKASVFGGREGYVPLKLLRPLAVMIPKKEPSQLRARLVYNGPLLAPVAANQCVAKLEIYRKKSLLLEQELCTVTSVKKSSLIKQARAAFYELTLGWTRAYVYKL